MAATRRGPACAILIAASLLTLFAAGARAQQTVIASTAPYWQVGVLDPLLSQACATGRFHDAQPERYVARFDGTKGAGILGVAKGDGLNLYDPDHHAKPNEDYFFRAAGTSSCAVYVGGRNGAAGGAPAGP